MPIKKKQEKTCRFFCFRITEFFVAADTVEEIGVLFDGVIGKLEKQVKRIADVSDAVTPEKEQAAQKLSSLLGHAVEVVPAAEADHFVKDKNCCGTSSEAVYSGSYCILRTLSVICRKY